MSLRYLASGSSRPTRAHSNFFLARSAQPRVVRASARVRGALRDGSRFWNAVTYGARPGVPGGLLTGWWLWERIAQRLWPAFVPPGSPYGLLKIRVIAHRGEPIDLPDSTHIDIGAMVCELHCDNYAVLNFSRHNSGIYTAGRREVAAIADWVIQSETCIEGLFGVTLLGAAAARLGFHRRTMAPTRRVLSDRLFMNGLLALYSIDGAARLRRGRTLKALPQEIWMSRAELLRKYGCAHLALSSGGSSHAGVAVAKNPHRKSRIADLVNRRDRHAVGRILAGRR